MPQQYYVASDDEYGGDDDEEQESNPPSPRASLPSAWPQSYRQSMDLYTMASPNLSLFSPSLNQLGHSYLRTSFPKLVVHSPETGYISASEPLRIPFLPGKLERGECEVYQQPPVKKPVPQSEKVDECPKVEADSDNIPVSQQGSSFLQALLNGMNVLAGVGVLSTPYALKEGGWIGLVFLFMLSLICCYTGILLRRCLDSAPGLETYPDIGQAAFGNIGRLVISIILYTELYACCVEFLILEGDNLSALFPGVHIDVAGINISSSTVFAVLTALFVLPTVWLRDLSLLSYVSAGGVIASLVVVLSVIWVGAVDGVGFHHSGPLLELSGLPVAVGLYGFCYSGHAVFPNIYSSMKNRANFNSVLRVSFVLCTLVFGGVAIMGFTMFGQETASQITLNLPKQFLASEIAVWTTVVNPFTNTYALTMTPVALSLEELLPHRSDSIEYYSYSLLIRTGLVASTVGVAVLVPFFGFVMAFIGSFLSMTVSVILPCACYLSILGKKTTIFQGISCAAIMSIGIVCLILAHMHLSQGSLPAYSKQSPPHDFE